MGTYQLVEYQCARAYGNWGPFDLSSNDATTNTHAPNSSMTTDIMQDDNDQTEEVLAN